ncbi:GNAT family N-acetyltransferase [Nocardioides sp.]|uniref:GNAT family N-acetyltransferase n=1 Tax=Nocardioides sp. TaxID=35761 RepID=UPI0035273508
MRDDFLKAYDRQLRGEGEVGGAVRAERHGPLWWAEFDDGWGFVTYADAAAVPGAEVDALVAETVAHFRDATSVERFEWKTRGHDLPADLGERLVAHGLVADEEETVMIGEAAALAVAVELPAGVVVRRAGVGGGLADDVRRARAMQDEVFGRGPGRSLEAAVAELTDTDEAQLWLAEAGGAVVSAGRLVRVPGTEFAGLWGGATLAGWRGRGIYRALTSARAAAALDLGVRYLQSDCTAMSRPILERSGLVAVTTTTPYLWERS